jgi:HEAT repeat protein
MNDLDRLCAELVCGDDARAEAAAVSLPGLGQPALEAVRQLLTHPDVDARWWAVRTLAGFVNPDDTTLDFLFALDDESSEVRQAAVMAFYHQPDVYALNALVPVLADPDPMTARLAANALIKIGTQATPMLLEVLKSGSPSAKLEAARALSEIKDPRAIPGLAKALETDSALLQYWVSLGLDNLGAGMVYLTPE